MPQEFLDGGYRNALVNQESGTSVSAGMVGGPSVYRGGILLVFKTANGNILQICCDYTNSIFIRIHWGEWKSWARITTVVI